LQILFEILFVLEKRCTFAASISEATFVAEGLKKILLEKHWLHSLLFENLLFKNSNQREKLNVHG
jgi:hypothetical protein